MRKYCAGLDQCCQEQKEQNRHIEGKMAVLRYVLYSRQQFRHGIDLLNGNPAEDPGKRVIPMHTKLQDQIFAPEYFPAAAAEWQKAVSHIPLLSSSAITFEKEKQIQRGQEGADRSEDCRLCCREGKDTRYHRQRCRRFPESFHIEPGLSERQDRKTFRFPGQFHTFTGTFADRAVCCHNGRFF